MLHVTTKYNGNRNKHSLSKLAKQTLSFTVHVIQQVLKLVHVQQE